MKLLCCVVFILSVMLSGQARGEFYSYTDGNGDVHFVDDIGKVPKKYRKQIKDAEPKGSVNVMNARPARVHPEQDDPPGKPKISTNGAKVEVFMTAWCGYCKKMIRFLNEKGIPYAAYDIEKDRAAAENYRALGGRGVPVVRIGSHIIRGYNPDAVLNYYNGGD